MSLAVLLCRLTANRLNCAPTLSHNVNIRYHITIVSQLNTWILFIYLFILQLVLMNPIFHNMESKDIAIKYIYITVDTFNKVPPFYLINFFILLSKPVLFISFYEPDLFTLSTLTFTIYIIPMVTMDYLPINYQFILLFFIFTYIQNTYTFPTIILLYFMFLFYFSLPHIKPCN